MHIGASLGRQGLLLSCNKSLTKEILKFRVLVDRRGIFAVMST